MGSYPPRLTLQADTAADLMSENPISLPEHASVSDAIALMARRGFSVAPVIDAAGRAVGVVSVSDLIIHEREFDLFPRTPSSDAPIGEPRRDPATVADIMTPAVLSVRPTALAGEVVRIMNSYRVHHVFVADETGTLIGVIGTSDLVRKLG